MVTRQFNAKWIGLESDANDPVFLFHREAFGTTEHLNLAEEIYNSVCPMFRKEFSVVLPVKSAVAYICGLGFFEFSLNGQRVDDRVLIPSKTDYSHHVRYETFDITNSVNHGNNCIGIMLGNGWYNTNPNFWGWQFQWYGRPRLIFELELEFYDGSKKTIKSDTDWKCTPSPIKKSCIYTGECYDARMEQPNWNTTGFDDRTWHWANVVRTPWQDRDRNRDAHFLLDESPASQVVETIKTRSVSEPQPGIFVFDFGVNFSGWVRLKCRAPAGTSIHLEYAENIDDKTGTLDTTSVHISSCDTYIAKGDNIETWEPRFTWHGFRYVKATGFVDKPKLTDLEGRFVHNNVSSRGAFLCDNKFISQLHACVLRGQLSNLQCGVPLDCPQRDERLGWLGDAHVTCEEACLNFDMLDFYRKWMTDIRAQQDKKGYISHIAPRPRLEIPGDAVWSSAVFIVPWETWLETGKIEILTENYNTMKQYFSYLERESEDFILPAGKYGDHLSVDMSFKSHTGTPPSIYTAFFFRNAEICSKIAALLGEKDESQYFQQCANNIRDAFNERFLKAGTYDNGSQTAFALPIAFGMVREAQIEKVSHTFISKIKANDYHPTTGIVGTKYLAEALDVIGRPDVFWKMLQVDGMPGWKYLLRNGKTTLPERWDQGGSGNHIVLGSIDYWFYRTLAGIQRYEDYPGYQRVHFNPFFPKGLTYVNASIQTLHGKVGISWQRNEANYEISITVPKDVKYTIGNYKNAKLPLYIKVNGRFLSKLC